jgi:NitT/TauT family transport system permease protein
VTVVLSMVAVVAVWWIWTAHSHVQSFVFPGPSAVARALWYGVTSPVDATNILYQLGITTLAAMIGLLIGGALGIVLGALAAQFKPAERLVMPYVFGIQTMPKIALAPLIFTWFGFGETPKEVLAGLLAFFPLVVNTYAGMNLVEQDSIDLFASLRATRLEEMVKLRLPTALPLVFAGLEIAVVNALLGAVVAEFIAGQDGIGTTMIKLQSASNTAGIFACLIVLAVAGILLHSIVRILRLKLVFWGPASHARE